MPYQSIASCWQISIMMTNQWTASLMSWSNFSCGKHQMSYDCTILGNPRWLIIAQSWETLDGLSLHNPGKPQMSYDCTILGNPRWLIIAQSWETLDGLSLHNHGKPQMVCDCAIHLLHDVINQLSAEPLFVWKVFGMWMEFRVLFAYTASVDYPPILGGWAKDKIFP